MNRINLVLVVSACINPIVVEWYRIVLLLVNTWCLAIRFYVTTCLSCGSRHVGMTKKKRPMEFRFAVVAEKYM